MEGKRIARYEILGRLGAGGMGEVYKALDTRMQREVALKVLPPHYVQDAERVARFKQEALATSALNHPNITTIFEIDEADGRHFISLEYIAGRSLRELLRTERLDLRQILDIAAQMAEGLHAAHEAGVVHRDLKPENVMVRPDGITKILDFGLAKLGGAHELPSSTAETLIQGSPSEGLTQPGVVLGTVAYMSPEQARGQQVDRRSDIFTFGSILLEMLTGTQAFERPSAVEVMHAIIHDTPHALQQIGGLPPELLRIVRKTMAKHSGERYQTAKDIAIDLRALQRDLDSGVVTGAYPTTSGAMPPQGSLSPSGGVPTGPRPAAGSSGSMPGGWPASVATPAGAGSGAMPAGSAGFGIPSSGAGAASGVGAASATWPDATAARRQRPVLWVGLGAGVVVVVAVVAVLFWGRGQRSAAPVTAPAQPLQMTKLTDTGSAASPVFSPNGQFVAYTNTDRDKDLVSIRLRQMASGSDVEVVPAQPNVALGNLVFTPDGNWLLYTRRQRDDIARTLWQVSPLGGAPREVMRDVDSSPSFAPDGKRFVFQRILAPQDIRFFTATFGAPGEPVQVHAAPQGAIVVASPSWSPADEEIVYQQIDRSDLLHRKLMIKNLKTSAERAVPGPGWMQLSDVEWSRDGKGLYVAGSRTWGQRIQIWHVGIADGAVHSVTPGFDEYGSVSVRQSGNALAAVRTTLASHLWYVPTAGTPVENGAQARQITRGTALMGNPRVAPDGKRIAYVSEAGGEMNLWVMGIDGTDSRQVTFDTSQDFWQVWSPNGRRLAYASEREGDLQVWVVDADGQNRRQLTREGKANYAPSWSPDGRWIAFISSAEDSSILYKIPAEGGAPVRLSRSERVMMLTEYSPDGNTILSWIQPTKASAQFDLGIFPADGAGEVRKVAFLPRSNWTLLGLRWMPDGKGFSTCEDMNGTQTLSVYRLDGGASQPRVTFTGEELLFNYSWTPDGRAIVAQRGTVSSDVVLLENVP